MPWGNVNRHAALQQGGLGIFDFPLSLVGDGLEAFYRLDPGQYTGVDLGDLTTISDQSGNAFTATGPSSHKPILDPAGNSFSRATAFFTGSSWMDIGSGLAAAMNATAWTMWTVTTQADDVSVSQAMFSIGSAAGYSLTTESSAWSVRSYGVGVAPDGTTDLHTHLVLAYRSAGVLHIEVDGVPQTVTSNTIGVNAPSGTSQLGQLVGGLFPLVGWLHEAGAVSRALTSDERAALAAYRAAWHIGY